MKAQHCGFRRLFLKKSLFFDYNILMVKRKLCSILFISFLSLAMIDSSPWPEETIHEPYYRMSWLFIEPQSFDAIEFTFCEPYIEAPIKIFLNVDQLISFLEPNGSRLRLNLKGDRLSSNVRAISVNFLRNQKVCLINTSFLKKDGEPIRNTASIPLEKNRSKDNSKNSDLNNNCIYDMDPNWAQLSKRDLITKNKDWIFRFHNQCQIFIRGINSFDISKPKRFNILGNYRIVEKIKEDLFERLILEITGIFYPTPHILDIDLGIAISQVLEKVTQPVQEERIIIDRIENGQWFVRGVPEKGNQVLSLGDLSVTLSFL